PRAPRPDLAARRAALPRAAVQPEEGQGPARAREARRPRGAARAHPRVRRVRGARERRARVRRRRRRHRPARALARHPPHHGDPASRGRHQGQPTREHQPAGRAAHGRRVRLVRRHRCARRGDLRPGDPGARGRQVRSRAPRALPVGLRGRLDHERAAAVGWEEPAADDAPATVEQALGPTDQQRLVRTIRAAARTAGIPAPRRPWLDELAPVYDLTKLRQRADAELVLGVSDRPEHQEQVPVYFRPDTDGHLAVYGTGGTGKSVTLRTLAAAAGITPRGGPVHVYGLDFAAGGLRMLADLPHVGAVIPGDDVDRVVRLMRMLREELDRRAPMFAEASAATITEYRAQGGQPDLPRILVLLDGYPAFRDDFEVGPGRAQ